MINEQVVRELAEFDADGAAVTTCYLNVDGRSNIRSVDVENELDRLLRRAEATAVDEPSIAADLQRISAHVRGGVDRRGVRGLAMYSCTPRELWRVVQLPVPVHSRIVVGHAPAMSQLESVVQQLRPIGVLLVDRQRSRLFVYELGELVERSEVVDELPRGDYDIRDQSARGDTSQHVEELVHQHLRAAAKAAFTLFTDHQVGQVTIGGSVESVAEVEGFLHPYLKERLTERIHVGAGASIDEIHDQVLAVQEAAERAIEAAAVAKLRDAVGAGHRGVAGLAETLGALGERRAELLLVSHDYVESGWRCPACGGLAAVGPTCAACGAGMERVDDVVEEAIYEALAQKCKIEMCVGNADLDVLGRIGALLRY